MDSIFAVLILNDMDPYELFVHDDFEGYGDVIFLLYIPQADELDSDI